MKIKDEKIISKEVKREKNNSRATSTRIYWNFLQKSHKQKRVKWNIWCWTKIIKNSVSKKLSFKSKVEIKTFKSKVEFKTKKNWGVYLSEHTLQEILKEFIQKEEMIKKG